MPGPSVPAFFSLRLPLHSGRINYGEDRANNVVLLSSYGPTPGPGRVRPPARRRRAARKAASALDAQPVQRHAGIPARIRSVQDGRRPRAASERDSGTGDRVESDVGEEENEVDAQDTCMASVREGIRFADDGSFHRTKTCENVSMNPCQTVGHTTTQSCL